MMNFTSTFYLNLTLLQNDGNMFKINFLLYKNNFSVQILNSFYLNSIQKISNFHKTLINLNSSSLYFINFIITQYYHYMYIRSPFQEFLHHHFPFNIPPVFLIFNYYYIRHPSLIYSHIHLFSI
jgi:hypothetical protein